MLLHVRIDTSGGGPTLGAAHEDAERNVLQKNHAIEMLTDPSVDASPDTRPSLTYCNRRVVYTNGRIEHVRWPLPAGATVCGACQANPLVRGGAEVTYIRDDQTASMV